MPTLGSRLAASDAREALRQDECTAAASRALEAERRREIEVSEAFFAKARGYFTESITSGLSSALLSVPVNGLHNMEFCPILGCGKLADAPASVLEPGKLAPFWSEFQRWATSEGLQAYWEEYVEAGEESLSSWWILRVKPQES